MTKGHDESHHYIFGKQKLGAGVGSISLLVYWISGQMTISTPESILKLGIFGGFGYGLSGVIALIVFAKIGGAVRKEFPEESTLGDIISNKLNPFGARVLLSILCIIGLFTLTIEGITTVFLLQLINIPIYIGLSIMITFCIIYAGIGGVAWIKRLAYVQIPFIFTAVIILPLYFFMQDEVQQIYNGLKLFHPYLLVTSNDYFLYIFIGLLIGIGVVLTDLATWQRLYMIQSEKVLPTFVLSGFIFLTVPLAFSSFFMVVLSQGGFQNMNTLWNGLKEILFHSPFLLTVFLFCSFSAITSTFGASLHAIVSLFLKNIIATPAENKRNLFQLRAFLSIIIGIVTLGTTLVFQSNYIEFLFAFGHVFASVIFPLIVILFSKRKIGNFIPISIIIACLIGYLSINLVGSYHSIWISAFASIALISSNYILKL